MLREKTVKKINMKTKVIGRILFCTLICIFALANMCKVQALKNNIVPDIEDDKPLSLTIKYFYQDSVPVKDVGIDIYKVADLEVKNGSAHYKLKKDFSSTNLKFYDMTVDESIKESLKLYETAKKKSVKPFNNKTDSRGVVKYDNLKAGMYLVVQAGEHTQGGKRYYSLPFLISLPSVETKNGKNLWNYDVEAFPKTSTTKPLPPSPPPARENPGTGDNSGLTIWGLVLIMSSIVLFFGYTWRRKNKNQA